MEDTRVLENPVRRTWGRSSVAPVWDLSGLAPRIVISRVCFFCTCLTVLIIATATTMLASKWIGKTFPGFLLNERMVLGSIGQYHWTGTEAGLRFPDKVIAADGQPVHRMRDIEQVIENRGVGTPVSYTIERGRDIIQVSIPSMRFTWSDLLMTFGVTFASGLVYVLMGAVVFVLKPDTKVSWAFLLACLLLSVYAITTFDMVSSHSGLIRIYLFVNTLFPAAFVHLSLLFPERSALLEKYPDVEFCPYLASLMLLIPLEVLYPNGTFLDVYRWVRAYTIVCAVTLLTSILRAFFVRRSVLARQRAKVLLLGALLAFPIPATAQYLTMFGGSWAAGIVIQNNFLAIPILLFPASIAYSIIRHNLFDVDVYIKRTVGYVMMTAIVSMGFLSVQTVANKFVFRPLFGEYGDEAFPIVFASLVVFLFNPINRKIQGVVDTVFFRKKCDYKETVRAMGSALTSLLNLDEIVCRVVQTLKREMFVETIGVVVLEHQKQVSKTYFARDTQFRRLAGGIEEGTLDYNDSLLGLLMAEKKLITKYDIEEDPRYSEIRKACGKSLVDLDATLAMPMIYQGELTGILTLGNKKSGHFYTREDIDLLTTMADQAAVAIENAKLAEQMKREQGVRTNLARYLSPQIVDQIVSNDMQVNLGGDKKIVTVLFSDIRNFTTITERYPPDQLVRILNEYFTEMAAIVFAHQGSLDKYIGDAIVAVFGSLINLENSAQNAARAAVEMMKRLAVLNERWQREYGFNMQIGIGLDTGEVFLGNIGSPERMEFTVIGDTVNVASRFSGLAKPGQILLTRDSLNQLNSAMGYRELPPTEVRGKTGKLEVFELETG